jgi:transglutaminase-like putative cysteine protease
VYVGLAFFRPVIGAVLVSMGLSWGARRLGAGPWTALLIAIGGWVMFCSAAFLGDTLFAGIVPTPATVGAAGTLFARGIMLMAVRPAPAFAEAGLMFLTITGVWGITFLVDAVVARLSAPLPAILIAMVLWGVPLAVAPPGAKAWVWTVPFLAAAAFLQLTFAGADLRRWGAWSPPLRHGHPRGEMSLFPSGGALALVAIVTGSLLAGALPGFGDKPWYEVRGMGGTTLTTNPIVDVRARLVARDTGPVMFVTADRPVYLRTTGLDVYSEGEEWTNSGIRGAPVDGDFPLEVALGPVQEVRLDVQVRDLPKAVLIPAPYQTVRVEGPLADSFQYDRANSTVTLDSGATLQRGDAYSLVADIPSPTPEQLDAAAVTPNPRLTELPTNVPDPVVELAQDIVAKSGATTPFAKALAVQQELRSWEYSVSPPQGHSGQAMVSFIANKVGYCEQYAGTMGVMLRSLGLPTRVAVGYTPGKLVDRSTRTYEVTNANAHAWVEVLFDGLGWIAFEPTPRSDGNVLVPSATNVAPARTEAELDGRNEPEPGTGNSNPGGPNQDLKIPRGGQSEQPTDTAAGPGRRGGDGGGGGGLAIPGWLFVSIGLLGVALLGAVVVSSRGHRDLPNRPPLERVLHARGEIEKLGRGLGMPPAPWETDAEYMGRLAHRHGDDARAAAQRLAVTVGRARYALALPPDDAVDAEQAAQALQIQLLTALPGWRRVIVRVRGSWSMTQARLLGVALPQLSWSPRRRPAPR